MYEVTIRKSFSAAHVLPEIGGKCEALHGHNFAVEVTVAGPELDAQGMLIDFRVLKGWLNDILEGLDHKYLTTLDAFKGLNPSSEQVARHIHDRLSGKLAGSGLGLQGVTVWESDNAHVAYRAVAP
jgi:6-pyruvoyltetrahydropterin/6-carboxytetrahydropterin synthase